MRALITGAAGFVGSHVAQTLLDQGHGVVAVDRPGTELPGSLADEPEIEIVLGDVRDPEFAKRALRRDCDVVLHLAAVVGVTNYLANPFDVVDVNVMGTRNFLVAANEVGARFLLASTSEIYGRNPKVPWAESDDRVLGGTQVGRWSYSTSKAAAEHLVLGTSSRFGLPVSIVRYFNAYGPRQVPNYVISKSVHRVLNGLPPLMYDTGEQTRCFTYIDDLVDGTLRAATDPAALGEVFNLGSDTETSIRRAIEVVVSVAGGGSDVSRFSTIEEFGDSYQDIDRRVPDVSKARAVLDWTASTTLVEGVTETIEWARAHPDWLLDKSTLESDPTSISISS